MATPISSTNPVDITRNNDSTPVGSSTRDDNPYILTKYILPALETRIQRNVIPLERQATILERVRSPLVRFANEELIWFLEDAAVQVVTRVNSLYLQSLRTSKAPSLSTARFDFSDTLRVLGETISIDGTTRAQRISEDYREDLLSRGVTIDQTLPVYTMEGGQVSVYGGLFKNPITAEADAILLPQPVFKTATGSYNAGSDTFQITGGDSISADYHAYVTATLTDNLGDVINGILVDINETTQIVRLDIDDTGFLNSGTITMTWKTPAYSQLYEILESLVVELAAVDVFSAIGEMQLAKSALENFEIMIKEYALPFFKL